MNIYKKLQAVRVELHGLPLKKTGNNNNKPFFELGDFLPSAIVLFEKHGLCGICSFNNDLATLTIHSTDDDSTPIVITSPFGSCDLKAMHVVQNIGATVTYQRRYLWMTALDIIEHDGIDAAAFDEFDASPYLATMEAAKDKESLDAAYAALREAGLTKVDISTAKAWASKHTKLAKAMPVSEERLKSALEQYSRGELTKEFILSFNLSDVQRDRVSAL